MVSRTELVFLHFLPQMCRDGAKIQKFSEILTSEICFFSNFAILKVEFNKERRSYHETDIGIIRGYEP